MLCWSNNLILNIFFFINSNIFRHLKLEIALAIPASNDEKYNWSNSARVNPLSIIFHVRMYKLNIIFFKMEWPD